MDLKRQLERQLEETISDLSSEELIKLIHELTKAYYDSYFKDNAEVTNSIVEALNRIASKYGSSYNIKCYINYSLLLSLNNKIAEASEDILLAPFEIDLEKDVASSILGTDTFKAIAEVDKELAELYLNPSLSIHDKTDIILKTVDEQLELKEDNKLFTGELANYNKHYDLTKILDEITTTKESDSIVTDKINRLLELKEEVISDLDKEIELLKEELTEDNVPEGAE